VPRLSDWWGMRLPQSFPRPLSVRPARFAAIGVVIGFLSMFPMSAGATAAKLSCSPASLRFGEVVLHQTETLLVTVMNHGQASVRISEIAVSGSEFTVSKLDLPLVLSAGQSVELNAKFTPTDMGQATGTVTISSNAENPTLVLDVVGDGVNSESLSANPSKLSFGQVVIGTGSTVPVVLTNDLSGKLTLNSARTTGDGFSVSGASFPLTLNAGESVTLNVTFTPQSPGMDGGSLFVSGPALNVPLRGTGTALSVNLLWNYSPDAVGYNVYRSSAPKGKYSKINSSLDPITQYIDDTVVSGQTYYYAATSVNSEGQESARSKPPVEAVIP
jgi:Abnormal spindle-like microcephaly-assoc'd, ASPM-SPD-2-Hydin